MLAYLISTMTFDDSGWLYLGFIILMGFIIVWLVVSTILKNMKVNGKDDIPYIKWKIIQMFQTTKLLLYNLTGA